MHQHTISTERRIIESKLNYGCNNSKVKEEDKEPPSLSDQYADIIPFDGVGGDFSGDSTMFYEDINDVGKSAPYLKEHPDLEITVEVYLECPNECTSQRCGHCTKDQCNNVSIAEEQAQSIEAILKKHDCPNRVNRKFWGCRDEKIKKDIIKIFISEKEKTVIAEPVPVVVDAKAIDEDNCKRDAALAQREAAMAAAEALLAKKLAALDQERDEVAREKQRLLDTEKQLQAVQEEQEETRAANETATQEAERKRLAYEKAKKIAEVHNSSHPFLCISITTMHAPFHDLCFQHWQHTPFPLHILVYMIVRTCTHVIFK